MSAMILKEITNLTIAELRTWLTEFHLSFLSIPEPERDGMRRELFRALHDVGGLSVLGLTMDAYDEAADMIGLPPRSEPDPKTGNWTATGDFDPHASITPAVVDHFIDWKPFWAEEDEAGEWIYPDILARGRGHLLYATHKDGKSLLMLWLAAQLATGSLPVTCIYLDYEMTRQDVRDRLRDMGYQDTEFDRLRYDLLPELPPLDSEAGATALMAMIDREQARLPVCHVALIIDTISRATAGEEDSADTWRDFYRHSGIGLKRRGVTWARLDHAGYDKAHPRGSTGKGDDVDVIWKLTKTNAGVKLDLDSARMNWVPERVTLGLFPDPTRYARLESDWPEGTGTLANIMDRLELPLDISQRKAHAALIEIDEHHGAVKERAALRWRREKRGGT